MRRRLTAGLTGLLLALLFLTGAAFPAKAEEGAFPELNEAGFLDTGEFVYENPDEGIWRYASSSLKIEIFRREQTKPKKVWYEAEVRCAEGSEMPHMVFNDAEKRRTRRKNGFPARIIPIKSAGRRGRCWRCPAITARPGCSRKSG